jgi:hypothetical protein
MRTWRVDLYINICGEYNHWGELPLIDFIAHFERRDYGVWENFKIDENNKTITLTIEDYNNCVEYGVGIDFKEFENSIKYLWE